MKREDCNLEAAGCSMVVAVTQDSVNATLKEYLDGYEGDFVNQAYCLDVNEQGEVVYDSVDYEKVKQEIEMDLYSIPPEKEKRTPEQESAIQNAYEKMGFVLGFRFRIGLPEVQDVSSLRDIVTFLESDISSTANVLYTMYLREFEVIKIASVPRKGYVFTSIKQTPEKPWYFTSRVKLDMKGQEFAKLSQELKDKLIPRNQQGNLKMDQILSIQQLYMDLNTAQLTDKFVLEGFDESDEIYQLFKQGFLELYVNDCKKNGGIILGYFAKQFPENTGQELIRLKNFNFAILPFYNKDGVADTKKQGLYTLDYVFAEDGEQIDLKKFANTVRWNWVDEAEKSSIHGRMIVDREGLIEKFADHFKKSLKCVQLIPRVQADVNLVKASYSINLDWDQTEPEFVYNGQKRYDYSYDKHDHVHESYLNTIDVDIRYQVTGTVTWEKDRVLFQTTIICDLSLTVDGGTVEGRIYDTVLDYGVRLAVNQQGKLVLEPDSEVKEKKTEHKITSDAWIDFATFGGAKKSLEETKDSIAERVDLYKQNAIVAGKGAFSDMNYWVFPGGKVFSFKAPVFSDEGNTMVGLVYAKPED